MAAQSKKRVISFSELESNIRRSIEGADESQAANLEMFVELRKVKIAADTRELDRLRTLKDLDESRLERLTERIRLNKELVRELSREYARATAKPPKPKEDEYVAYGYARDAKGRPIAKAIVKAYTSRTGSKPVGDHAVTDKDGYFELVIKSSGKRKTDADDQAKPVDLFIAIEDPERKLRFVDERPVVPHHGGYDFRDIITDHPGEGENDDIPLPPPKGGKSRPIAASERNPLWGWRGKSAT